MMRALAALQKRFRKRPSRGAWMLLALLVLMAPRLLPASTLGALDLLEATPAVDRAEVADQNFPGSAFFFAQGAFDPQPGLEAENDVHVLKLDRSPPAPATPFHGLTAIDRYRAANCLTSAIYYEAANEPDEGQRAVAQVVLNRVRHPAWPNSVCGVVYQGSERTDMKCQFTFSCDGAMARAPSAAAWARARRVALAALSGYVYAPAGLATHYHTLAVRPNWAPSLQPVAVIGAHIFYRWQGANGMPQAFRDAYTGRELQSGPAPRRWTPSQPVQATPVPSLVATPPAALPALQSAPLLPSSGDVRPEYRNSGRPRI